MKRIYRLLALIAVILGAAGVYFIYFSSPAPVPRPMPKFVPKTGVAAKAPAPAAAPLSEQPVQPSRLFVADINNDGIDLKQGKGDYFFDTNADNLAEDIDWIAPSDAVLMTDCERNRPLRSLEELQKFDSNGDGRIDMNDRAFLNLTLWSDKNLNNLCEPGETRLLPDLRIKVLVIENTDALKPVKIFNASARAVGFMEAAENIDLYEVNFTPLSVRKRYIGPREVSDEIAKLPNLNGLGSLVDLHYAAMADPGLADLLTQLKNLGNQDAGQFFKLYTRMLERWGRVDGIPIDEKISGLPHRKLALLAKVSGISEEDWLQKTGNAAKINEIYDDFYFSTAQAIMAQTMLHSALPYYVSARKKTVDDEDLKNIFSQAQSVNATNDPAVLLLVYDVLDNSLKGKEYNQQIYDENLNSLFAYNNLAYMKPGVVNRSYQKGYAGRPPQPGKSYVFFNSPENENFTGGAGNDIYYYHRGDGLDTITENGGLNHIIMPDINFAELEFKNDGLDLQIFLKGTTSQGIIIKNYFADTKYHVDSIDFNNGSLLKLNTVEENITDSFLNRIHLWYLKLKA